MRVECIYTFLQQNNYLQMIKETILRMRMEGFSFSEIAKILDLPYQKIRNIALLSQNSYYSEEKEHLLSKASGEMFAREKTSDLKLDFSNENYIVEYPDHPDDIMNLGISALRLSSLDKDERIRVLVLPKNLINKDLERDGIKILPEEELIEGNWIWKK